VSINLTYGESYSSGGEPKIYLVSNDKSPRIEDSQLWLEFQAGNETAYATIYNDNVAMLYGYGLKLVNDKELIKDCIQDLFIEIWNTKHKLAPVRSIKSYLFKSIRRKIISEAIKRRKTTLDSSVLSILKIPTTPSAEYDLIEKQRFDRQRQKLKEAMRSLTDRQREVIHLKYYVQLSYKEIAGVMTLSTKGVYKLMGRSIKFLRQNISDKVLE